MGLAEETHPHRKGMEHLPVAFTSTVFGFFDDIGMGHIDANIVLPLLCLLSVFPLGIAINFVVPRGCSKLKKFYCIFFGLLQLYICYSYFALIIM